MTSLFTVLIASFLAAVFDFKSNCVVANDPENSSYVSNTHNGTCTDWCQLVGWRFDHLSRQLVLTLFITIVTLVKLCYRHLPRVAGYIPESCLLIFIGILYGFLLKHNFLLKELTLTPHIFFYLLLPPIILESSFELYNQAFAKNLLSIFIFAVCGSLLCFLFIGLSLWGLSVMGAFGFPTIQVSIVEALLFSSLIVAVDPVVVLNIYHDIGVDVNLYYLVFGESLFNDAITIVLYNMMGSFTRLQVVHVSDVMWGIASFFTVSVGGAITGIAIGTFSCLLTRITHVAPLLEPVFILSFAYLSYLVGDLFKWSGIVSMVVYGLIQAAFAFGNIHNKSVITVKRFTKMSASLCETMIFLFLGIELVTMEHRWHTGFSLWSLVLCLLSRGLIIFVLATLINRYHLSSRSIGWTEKFVLAYGGLRGAVAYSLASLIKKESFSKTHGGLTPNTIITTTLFIILFTVGVIGMTMKPLVKLLHIQLESRKTLSMVEEINERVLQHMLAGVEAINGRHGHNFLMEAFQRFEERYIRRFLQSDPVSHDQQILATYEKLSLAIHYATVRGHNAEAYMTKIPQLLQAKLQTKQPTPKKIWKESMRKSFLKAETVNEQFNSFGKDLDTFGFISVREELGPSDLRRVFRRSSISAVQRDDHDATPMTTYKQSLETTLQIRNAALMAQQLVAASSVSDTVTLPTSEVKVPLYKISEKQDVQKRPKETTVC